MKPETQDQFVTDANGKFVTDANGKLARPDRRRVSNVVDKWVRSGGPLFPPGSGQAIEYVERLWAASPTLGKLTATYGERSGSACSHEDRYDTNAQQEIEAIASWFEPAQWRVFETLVRDGATVGDPHTLLSQIMERGWTSYSLEGLAMRLRCQRCGARPKRIGPGLEG